MADLLKNIFSKALVELIADAVDNVTIDFSKDKFLSKVFDKEWDKRELKQRTSHVTDIIITYLSEDFKICAKQVMDMGDYFIDHNIYQFKNGTLALLFLPDIIEKQGIDFLEESVIAFKKITPLISCEFGVRPFFIRYPKEMMSVVLKWAKDEDEHVRRLASEGSRPRLPWGIALQAYKKNPDPLKELLETLKNDPSEYVRRSVANNLNDISKDHPEWVIDIANNWIGKTAETDWIVKHACRTLLKEGRSDVMEIFGYSSPKHFKISNFDVVTESVEIGDALTFHFELNHLNEAQGKVRLEYGIYYLKKNGNHNRKVFKISEKEMDGKTNLVIKRNQPFKVITTRTFYTGEHFVSIIINGKEMQKKSFCLI
ncbi:DNA alkylation repair protein [Flammeovirga sp. MY04]|uniref:DNA alkylation repair protein n=1 Tax=Flammeovirga sp. MY04 TaxID=1191459 RepID=UPI0008061E00|nr:DNA alkylation repair protein [Flammeovirga sp. MY04]ANQ52182.1 DNA alkylation repair protein [Flammeovirga sp. MY04]